MNTYDSIGLYLSVFQRKHFQNLTGLHYDCSIKEDATV